MGCVFGKEIQSTGPPSGEVVVGKGGGKGGDKDLSVWSGRREKVVVDSVSKLEEEGAGGGGGGGEVQNGGEQKDEERKDENARRPRGERRRSRPNPRLSNPPKHIHGEQVAAGWPSWLSAVAGEAINGWTPRRADSFEKIDKARGKIVALKKVRFDNLEPESVRFMAREILILRRLDHPNVVKLQGLVTSRMSCSLYLVFDYMEHDLAGLASSPESSLQSLRPPELLLGATEYGVGVDLWSAGCILAELFAGKPIMTGRTEVEQLHRIFKLCGSPSEEYWKKSKLPHATIFKPQQSYKRCIKETFKDFPPSSLPLIDTLLAIDPSERQTATAALKSEFFTTKPYACDPSSLPKYPPSKEMDAKRRDEEARRLRAAGKTQTDAVKKTRARDRGCGQCLLLKPMQSFRQILMYLPLTLGGDYLRRRLITHANAKSKSEKFPPPHQDAGIGFPLGSSNHMDPTFDPPDVPFTSMNFSYTKDPMQTWSGPLVDVGAPKENRSHLEGLSEG
ncbi:hypothetical protein DH2020_043312 [Rehmannia glutinosa]|uniref:Protein kinase domain-containing protein n=1 Tax=Rehmannia glutinosa TaxID=99300 RepID=A0ABR0UL79_REHGL